MLERFDKQIAYTRTLASQLYREVLLSKPLHHDGSRHSRSSVRNRCHNGLKDHDPSYRAVALSAMCSLVALGPEASTPVVFVAGLQR
eukprot:5375549-Amphidinium_carterae.1